MTRGPRVRRAEPRHRGTRAAAPREGLARCGHRRRRYWRSRSHRQHYGVGERVPSGRSTHETRARPSATSARVRGMFAQTTQNWWWTAHPAAR
ncbi:trp operon leader peptide [Streptomyces sp. NPDC056749]|uniref:trp operon leader peptide n=1 Tax=Streptomyces sp. NPDC056749 TaxID=3345936 RepID=UPI0036B619EC